MRKLLFIIFVLLYFCAFTSAQNKIILYFNKDWEVTNNEKAVYVREAEYDLQDFKLNGKVSDRDLKGNLVMEGNYLAGKRNGEFTFYYGSGNIESKGVYLNNKRVGEWIYYYPDSRLKQKVIFKDYLELDFSISEYYNRTNEQLIKNGTGKWMNDSLFLNVTDHSFKRITGDFKDGLKCGTWRLKQFPNNKTLITERFKKGKIIDFKIKKGLKLNGFKQKYAFAESRAGQRIQEEFQTGSSREETLDSKSQADFDEISRKIYLRTGSISINTTPGEIVLPADLNARYDLSRSFKDVESNNLWMDESVVKKMFKTGEIMIKIPDQNSGKLFKTEMILLDKKVFPENLLISTDIESFFRTIAASKIDVKNRKALYLYGNDKFKEYVAENFHLHTVKAKGTIQVECLISSSGQTKEIKLVQGISREIDDEVIRILSGIERWLPALENYKPLESKVYFSIRVNN